MNGTLSHITCYPAKSMAGIGLASALVEPRGLQGDRRFMLVDDEGRFLTARKHPKMLLVAFRRAALQLSLSAPDMEPAHIEFDRDEPTVPVTVWKDALMATAVSAQADAWLSEYLGLSCHLVFMGPNSRRSIDPSFGQPEDEVSFADGYPILVLSQASVDALNKRLRTPLGMERFRPNLVIADCPAHAEDDWQRIRVGDAVELELVKRCSRCVLTTIDSGTAERDSQQEPLRTLAAYRRGEGGQVYFGMNAIPRRTGRVRIGDPVTVLAAGPGV